MKSFFKQYEVTIWIIGAVLIVAALLVYSKVNTGVADGKYDSFAQCLAQRNVTMYGAVWCPWCQKEKANFGSSFRFVPYVECPENTKKCLDLGIESYPTWIFSDGSRLVGYQGLEKLSLESGCPLPE